MERPGPTSFEDLRTVDGVPCLTFTQAAKKLGIVEDDEMHRRSLRDAANQYMGIRKLRHYFAMILAHWQPSDPQALFEEFWEEMNPLAALNNSRAQPKTD